MKQFFFWQVFDDMGQDVTPKSLLQIDPTVKWEILNIYCLILHMFLQYLCWNQNQALKYKIIL